MKPHQHTDKTPAELAEQAELRLRLRVARAFLKDGLVDKAIGTLEEVISNPSVRAETRTHAVETLLVAISRAAGKAPSVTFNQGLQINAADLLRLVQSEGGAGTTGCMSPLSTPADPTAIPTRDLQDGHRLSEPVQQEALPAPSTAPEPTDGAPERVRSGDASEATPPAPAQRNYPACPRCGARTDDEPHACPVQPEV